MDMENLRNHIVENGITSRDLAGKLGISLKTLNAKLNNRSRITIREADAISKILKLENPSALFFAPQSQICNTLDSLKGGDQNQEER